MRIAMVAPMVAPLSEPHLGGAQAFLADLARGLQTRGHDVHVYAASGSALPGVTVIDTGVDAETLRDCLYRPGAPRAGGAAVGAVEAFARAYAAIRDAGYDLVHNHAFDPPAITCACSVPAPVVHTLHLPPDREVAAALDNARRSPHPPAVAAVSPAHRRAWRLLAPIHAVLPDGVPTARIPWSDAPGSGLVFAGRLSPEKGVAEAIDIARAARASIDVYGDPYDRAYAEGRVYPRDGEPGVVVHPALDRALLWKVMARAAAVLCPARWDEPFGLVAAEAQAAGTPVIAFRRGALAETVLDGVTGFLVPPDDIVAAAEAVPKAARLRRADCRRHAEACLDLDGSLDAHERLYRRLARAVGTGSPAHA